MNKIENPKIAMALSGGVDSAVSAMLLKESNVQLDAFFIQCWDADIRDPHCTAATDYKDAQKVAKHLNINLHYVDQRQNYFDEVFETMLSQLQQGLTPNPDILCNERIKFGYFYQHCMQLGFDQVATGHYVKKNEGLLSRAVDLDKDQSYFLAAVTPNILQNCIFPLGERKKTQIRQLASDTKLAVAAKPDSTGICFIGKRKFSTFINTWLKNETKGRIYTCTGEYLGKHEGLCKYTFGQRKGIGIGGLQSKSGAAWYVLDKLVAEDVLVVTQDKQKLISESFEVENFVCYLNTQSSEDQTLQCNVQTRYRSTEIACRVRINKQGDNAQVIALDVETGFDAVTPGQTAVFYINDRLIGYGTISNTSSQAKVRDTLNL